MISDIYLAVTILSSYPVDMNSLNFLYTGGLDNEAYNYVAT